MSVDVLKSQPPETLRQAQRWHAVKDRYVEAGLCDRCAAQAAWAHQDHGDTWETIHPPCTACKPIVVAFPVPTTSPPWRKFQRPQDRKRTRAAPPAPGEAVEDIDGLHSDQDVVLL